MAGIPNRKKAITLTAISTPGDLKTYSTGTYVIPPGTDGYVLQSDSTSVTGFSWVLTSSGGGTPTGLAGGDLTGSYPNPTLASITSAGTSGSATIVPIVTIDAKGRVTTLSSATITGVTPGGSAGGDLTGSYPNPTVGTAKITPTKTDLTQTWNFTGALQSGSQAVVLTNDSRLSDSRSPTGSAGGDLTGTYPSPTLAVITTAGTSGSASVVPVVTIDTKGRVTTLSSAAIAITTSSVSGLGTAAGLTYSTSSTLTENSDSYVATQKATKTYADTKVAKSGDTMTGQLTVDVNGTSILAKNSTANGIGSLTIAGSGNATEYSNFYLQDLSGYPAGNLWSFSMRNDKSFLFFSYGGVFVNVMRLQQNGGVKIGNTFASSNTAIASNVLASSNLLALQRTTATAYLHIGSGSAAASTAPLKFTSGSVMTAVESGSVEYDGTHLYFSPVASRKIVTYRKNVTSISSAQTASVDSLLAASGTFTITLPNPSTVGNGAEITVKKTSTNASTITISASAGTIDGATTTSLTTQYSSYTFVSDGSTNWWIV